MAKGIVTLERGKEKFEFSHEHAERILNHPIQDKVDKDLKFKLPSDSKWMKTKEGKLVEKKK